MNVIALTAFVGLALVAFFVAFFLQQTNADSGGEQDALMPLAEEKPRAAARRAPANTSTASHPPSSSL